MPHLLNFVLLLFADLLVKLLSQPNSLLIESTTIPDLFRYTFFRCTCVDNMGNMLSKYSIPQSEANIMNCGELSISL